MVVLQAKYFLFGQNVKISPLGQSNTYYFPSPAIFTQFVSSQ